MVEEQVVRDVRQRTIHKTALVERANEVVDEFALLVRHLIFRNLCLQILDERARVTDRYFCTLVPRGSPFRVVRQLVIPIVRRSLAVFYVAVAIAVVWVELIVRVFLPAHVVKVLAQFVVLEIIASFATLLQGDILINLVLHLLLKISQRQLHEFRHKILLWRQLLKLLLLKLLYQSLLCWHNIKTKR